MWCLGTGRGWGAAAGVAPHVAAAYARENAFLFRRQQFSLGGLCLPSHISALRRTQKAEEAVAPRGGSRPCRRASPLSGSLAQPGLALHSDLLGSFGQKPRSSRVGPAKSGGDKRRRGALGLPADALAPLNFTQRRILTLSQALTISAPRKMQNKHINRHTQITKARCFQPLSPHFSGFYVDMSFPLCVFKLPRGGD